MSFKAIARSKTLNPGGQYDPEWIRDRAELEIKFAKELKIPIEIGDDLSVIDESGNEIGFIELGTDRFGEDIIGDSVFHGNES